MAQNFRFPLLLSIVLVLLVLLGNQTYAQKTTKRQAVAVRNLQEIKIDGYFDETAWDQTEWQGDFIQREPYDGSAPSMPTSFKVLYDDDNIYVAVRSFDSAPDSIERRLSRRDSGDGDAIGVEFDSYCDLRSAFSFIVFASGGKADKYITADGDNEDDNWDAIWDAKTNIDKQGWTAEIKIPLNQLRFNKLESQTWGFQVGRYIFRKGELSLWQPIPRDASGWVHQYGLLTGIEDVKPKKQIEIAPYVVAKLERFEAEEGNPFQNGKKQDISAGLDAKIGLTNDVTLDLTVLPDFGQVEADPSEVNLTAFESYFPEKRPFFIEGKNLFDFGFSPGDGDNSAENLFYSRRIGRRPHHDPDLPDSAYSDIPENTRILGAAKVTGKTKGLSFGIMEALTAVEYAEIDAEGLRSEEMVEPLTNYFVGSVSQEFNNGNTQIGAMGTATNRRIDESQLGFLHQEAYSGGLQFVHQWNNKNYYFAAKTYFSHVAGTPEAILETQTSSVHYFQRPDATHLSVDSSRTSLTGQGGSLNIGKGGSGHWKYTAFVTWKSPELEVNDIGFVRQSDEIFQVLWAQYRIWKPFSIFREISINFNQWSGHNFAGERLELGGNTNMNFKFKNYWYFGTGINFNGESLSISDLRGGPALLLPGGINLWSSLESDGRKRIVGELFGSFSKNLNVQNQSLGIEFTYKPTHGLVINLSSSAGFRNRVLQYVDNIESNNQVNYVNATLDQTVIDFELRFNYSITPDLSIQYYGRPFFAKGQYTDFKEITDPRANSFYDRFHTYGSDEIQYDDENDRYLITEKGANSSQYSIDNPDFNFKDFQSNLVLRWEYKPGSALFLVYSQNREHADSAYGNPFSNDFDELFQTQSHQVFLIKFSYRFI